MDYFDDPDLCLICFGYHPLVYCKYFQTFTIIQRQYLVKVHRYCSICFSKAHLRHECTLSESCGKCHGLHHTMLHPRVEKCQQHQYVSSCRCHCGLKCDLEDSSRTNCINNTFKRCHCLSTKSKCCNSSCQSSNETDKTCCITGFLDCDCQPKEYKSHCRQSPTFGDFQLPTTSRATANPLRFTRENPQQCCHNPIHDFFAKTMTSDKQQGDSIRAEGTFNASTSSTAPQNESLSDRTFNCMSQKCHNTEKSYTKDQRLCAHSLFVRRSRSPSIESELSQSELEGNSSYDSSETADSSQKSKQQVKGISIKPGQTKNLSNNVTSIKPCLVINEKFEEISSERKKKLSSTVKAGGKRCSMEEEEALDTPAKKSFKLNTSLTPTETFNQTPDFAEIQHILQQLLKHLKSPKEYRHTPSNWRRQALLRQQLSVLKTQLRQIIQNLKEITHLQISSQKQIRHQKHLKFIFKYLLNLLTKCQVLTSSKQLVTGLQQLKKHLQHNVKNYGNDKFLEFQNFIKELQNLVQYYQDAKGGSRVDLLKQKLRLRILLRQILKAALEQLNELL